MVCSRIDHARGCRVADVDGIDVGDQSVALRHDDRRHGANRLRMMVNEILKVRARAQDRPRRATLPDRLFDVPMPIGKSGVEIPSDRSG